MAFKTVKTGMSNAIAISKDCKVAMGYLVDFRGGLGKWGSTVLTLESKKGEQVDVWSPNRGVTAVLCEVSGGKKPRAIAIKPGFKGAMIKLSFKGMRKGKKKGEEFVDVELAVDESDKRKEKKSREKVLTSKK